MCIASASCPTCSKRSTAPARTENCHGTSRSRGETARATPAAPWLGDAPQAPVSADRPRGSADAGLHRLPRHQRLLLQPAELQPHQTVAQRLRGLRQLHARLHRRPPVLGHADLQRQVGLRRGRPAAAVRARARADRQPDLRGTGRRPRAGLLALGRLRCAHLRDLGAALQLPDRYDALPRRRGHRLVRHQLAVRHLHRLPGGRRRRPVARCPLLRDPDPRRPPVRLQRPVRGRRGRRRQPLPAVPAHHAAAPEGRHHPVHAAARGVGVQQRRPALHVDGRRSRGRDDDPPALHRQHQRRRPQLRLRVRPHHGRVRDSAVLFGRLSAAEQVRGGDK